MDTRRSVQARTVSEGRRQVWPLQARLAASQLVAGAAGAAGVGMPDPTNHARL